MNDNSKERLHNVFFYGLYMDPNILKQKGVIPRNPRIAKIENYELRIGEKATLLRSTGKVAYGLVYSLKYSEINDLYWGGAGLNEYIPEALIIDINGENIAALCCNLLIPPEQNETNPEYQQKLETTMKTLGLPTR